MPIAVFQEQIPLKVRELDADTDKSWHLILFALLTSDRHSLAWYGQEYGVGEVKNPGKPWENLSVGQEELFGHITGLSEADVKARILAVTVRLALNGETVQARAKVAEHLGVDVAAEWRITGEYLQKKTKAEILELGNLFEIFSKDRAKTFLFEDLGKKRGKFETCKKSELVRVFMESGIDLGGLIPPEILERDEAHNSL